MSRGGDRTAPDRMAGSGPPESVPRARTLKAGAIGCHVEFEVDALEMRTWSADRIARFFDGIAKMVYAVERTHDEVRRLDSAPERVSAEPEKE